MTSDRLTRAASAAEQLSAALWEVLRQHAESGNAREAEALARRVIEISESFSAIAAADLAPPDARSHVRDASRVSSAPSPEAEHPAPPTDQDKPEPRSPERGEGVVRLGLVEPLERRHEDDPQPEPPQQSQADTPTSEPDPRFERERTAFAEEPPAREPRQYGWDAQEPRSGELDQDGGHTDDTAPFAGPARAQPAHSDEWRPAGSDTPSVALVDEYDSTQIEVTDARGGGYAPVGAAIERRLQRHAADRMPFSVLLVEVLDVERLRALRSNDEVLREIWAVESAVAEQLRPADTLLREIDGRWWLVAPDTDAVAARQLAERLASAARRFSHRGAPLRVAVGIAVCPDHGLDPTALIGHADVDLYAAQAAGRSIGGGFDDEPRPA